MSEVIQKQRKLNKFWFIWNLVEALILFVGGVLSIVAGVISANQGSAAPSSVENAVAYVVGAFIILDGILRVVMYLSRGSREEEGSPLVLAGFEISLGILLVLIQTHFTNEHIFTYMVVNLVAIILMVVGGLLLTFAIYQIARKHAKLTMPVLEILFAAILFGVGVVVEVLYNTESSRSQLVLIMIGSILCLASIGMLIANLLTRAKAKKELDKAEKEENGDYEVAKSSIPSKKKAKAKPAEVIDASEEVKPAEVIEGPKAIEHKE